MFLTVLLSIFTFFLLGQINSIIISNNIGGLLCLGVLEKEKFLAIS